RPWMRTSGAGSAMAVSASVTWWTWRDAIVKVFILLFCFKASPDWQAGHAAGRKRCTVTDAVDHESRSVLLDVAGDGVATLTLNRPHRHNAWNPVIERRFYQLLDQAGRDDRVRAVGLTGTRCSPTSTLPTRRRCAAPTARWPRPRRARTFARASIASSGNDRRSSPRCR